jgi:hypothetical protein
MATARMDVSSFVGKVLEEDDVDLLREGVRVLCDEPRSFSGNTSTAPRWQRPSHRSTTSAAPRWSAMSWPDGGRS